MFYAPFVGCINKRPGCCPFTPKTMTNTRSRFVVATQLFPQPLNEQDATLSSCASDYHSISGGCCPRGYEPWTSALGDQTPCVSQLPVTTTAPPLVFTTTGGSTTKPTVTMTGVVFAMQYPVLDSDDAGLSAGAIAGITVGCVLGVLAVIGIAFLIRRHRQQSHQLTRLKRDLHDNFYGPDAGTSEVPTGARDLTASNLEQLRAHRFNFAGMAKEEQADSPAELYAPGSPDLTLHGSTQRGSALTPRPEDYARDFFELPSTGETIHELSAGPEVQMAKPQRLSRGYPRIVYTQSQGQASSTSIQSDSEGRPGSGSSGRLSTRPSTVPPTRSDSIGPEPAGGRLTAGRASP
ncbi:hypothetical protein QBC35DRAFT_6777 [Podospora australis]|uniref:Uncharacterized protein n=1 Tax=Podospora australis TaxID=1536484 RepID=A0AAN6X691_9PEZI|nr:hypothetical protein QBC35DRAFT_6777 [Podospora australis]